MCSDTLTVGCFGRVSDVTEADVLSRGVVTKVFLPTELVNSATTILNLARHQEERCERVAQFEAQIEHMCKAYSKTPAYSFALRTIGLKICLQEQDFSQFIIAALFQPRAAVFANKEWFAERRVAPGDGVGWIAWALAWHRPIKTVHQRWTLYNATEELLGIKKDGMTQTASQVAIGQSPSAYYEDAGEAGAQIFPRQASTSGVRLPTLRECLGGPQVRGIGTIVRQWVNYLDCRSVGVNVGTASCGVIDGSPVTRPRGGALGRAMAGRGLDVPPVPNEGAIPRMHDLTRAAGPPPGLLHFLGDVGLSPESEDDLEDAPRDDVIITRSELLVLRDCAICTGIPDPGVGEQWERLPPKTAPRHGIKRRGINLDDAHACARVADHTADQEGMDVMHNDGPTIESVVQLPPEDLQGETPGDGGDSVAQRRSPHLGPPPCLFSNALDNLKSAEHLRNNGDAGPVRVSEMHEAIKSASDAFIRVVLDPRQVRNFRVREHTEELPKKYTCRERLRIEEDMWYLNSMGLPPRIKTAVKKEVTSKPKPRPIQAHGTERLALNCPLLGTFERILKTRLGQYTIKGRKKTDVLKDICASASLLAEATNGPVFPLVSDHSAFEFGINADFKLAEASMLSHIMKLMNSDYAIFPDDLVEEAIKERLAPIDWVYEGRDGRGFRLKAVIHMLYTMRQSGDRGTSSLNWFANLLWVCVSLCNPRSYDEFFREMLRGNHRKGSGGYFSFPAWDGMGRISLVLNMEGDDLLGWASQDVMPRMLEVSHAAGWKTKNELVKPDPSGPGHVTYVGFHLYTNHGVPTMVDGHFVMYPELKRFLTTKAWSTVYMEASARAACEVLNYEVYARLFQHLEPVSNYCRAIAAGWRRHQRLSAAKPVVSCNTAVVRDLEHRIGMTVSNAEIRQLMTGYCDPDVTDSVKEVALAMSSHACGHAWGLVTAGDVCDLVGMTELYPLSQSADLQCRMPRCWWSEECGEDKYVRACNPHETFASGQ